MQGMTLGAWFLRLALLGVVVLAVGLGVDYLLVASKYQAGEGAAPFTVPLCIGLRLLVVAWGLGCGALLWLRKNQLPTRITHWWWLRGLFCLGLGCLLTITAVDLSNILGEQSTLITSARFSLAGLFACLWASLLLRRPEALSAPLTGFWRGAELAVSNVVICLLLFEGLLTVYGRYSTSKIFWDYASVQSTLRKFRQTPGAVYLGHPFNSDGYYDDEFFAAGDKDFVVALITDSFGVGVTPKRLNFSQVVEDGLQEALGGEFDRVAVHNFGIPSINIPEYLYLLEGELGRFSPSMILVCLFVGNDLLLNTSSEYGRSSLTEWWVYKLPQRIMLAIRHGTALPKANEDGEKGLEGEWRVHQAGSNMTGKPDDYWFDPAQQVPHFPWEKYVETEILRARMAQPNRPGMQANYRKVRKALREMTERAQALGAPLAVAVLPDEYQVNDALWQAVVQSSPNPGAYERFYPQQVVLSALNDLEVPVLDLLPVLREAEQESPTFHPQDSHWNARGNQVAGKAIARWLLTLNATQP